MPFALACDKQSLDSDRRLLIKSRCTASAPQPPAEGPEDGEDEEALHERAGGAFEETVA